MTTYLIHFIYKNRPSWNLTNPYTESEYKEAIETEREICKQYNIDESKRIKKISETETKIYIF